MQSSTGATGLRVAAEPALTASCHLTAFAGLLLQHRPFESEKARDGVVEVAHRLDVPCRFENLDSEGGKVVGQLQRLVVGDLGSGQHHHTVRIGWDLVIAQCRGRAHRGVQRNFADDR
jgi:hypothetical protein